MADGEKAGRLGARLRRRRKGTTRARAGQLRTFVLSPAGLRTICCALILLGIASAGILLARPVTASYPDDFLLRYGGLGASKVDVPEAQCGSTLDTLSREADASTLGTLASDVACRKEASRRLAVALAGGALIVVAGIMGLYLSSPRPGT